MVSQVPRFSRGNVFRVKFHPPDKPDETIPKYVVNLQEGKIVAQTLDFVGVVLTTQRADCLYPWEVFVSEEECGFPGGVKVKCHQIHTIPKEDILDFAYKLSDVTMEEIDQKLLLGVGIVKLEELELLEEIPEEEIP